MKRRKIFMLSPDKIPPEYAAVALAMGIAAVRVIYDKEETRPARVVLEALLCGLLSLTATSAIVAMDLDLNWSIFVGGVIGYLGSTSVRALAVKFINRKVS